MNWRSIIAHCVLLAVLLLGTGIVVSLGLSGWWRTMVAIVAIGATGAWLRYLTPWSVFGVVGTVTALLPLGALLAISYYYDGYAAFAKRMSVGEWTQAVTPTIVGVLIVWLRNAVFPKEEPKRTTMSS